MTEHVNRLLSSSPAAARFMSKESQQLPPKKERLSCKAGKYSSDLHRFTFQYEANKMPPITSKIYAIKHPCEFLTNPTVTVNLFPMWFYQLILCVETAVDDTGEKRTRRRELFTHRCQRKHVHMSVSTKKKEKSKSRLSCSEW